ncbi:unnamed protein product [Adineta steineri]|uniref:Uncharacterized protein n=1 Tax=Adineta steineri TaxID=433720 RepID=A0A814HUK0_9BILA|nr:unnamed protein product [Adineta steineri]CAF3807256.1 unnamed protein product [Adineta steineri]
MVYKSFEGCAPKQNPRISLNFLTDMVQFSSRIIRLVINILYVYRFITAINGLRLRSQSNEDDDIFKIRAPYMCATRHHLSVEPDVIELHKELRKLMYRFKHEVRYIAHTIQHYPHLLFQTVPLLESSIGRLQCNLDDLEMAATFDGKTDIQPKTTNLNSISNESQNSGKLRRLENDEEQVYLITRNIHLTLHTLLINSKLIHLTTKNGIKAGMSTLLFPFLYDIGKKFCLSFYYLKLLSKYVSYRAIQTENRPVPPLTDTRINIYPANRNTIIEANQFLVDNFAKTVKKRNVRFNVAAQQCLPSSILTRRFSNIKNSTKSRFDS